MQTLFWRLAAALVIGGLFYVGTGLRNGHHGTGPLAGRAAHAGGVGLASNTTETVITSSSDGRTLYIWRYLGVKPPMYLGKAEIGSRDR